MAESLRADLERFVIDDSDLEKLEERLGEANIFEVLGMVNAEIRHSNFLAWILDPAANHGLGDAVLRAFLKRALSGGVPGNGLTALDAAVMNLDDTEVYRERAEIDLLLVNRTAGFVIVIENKITAGEHGDQLAKYRGWVEATYREMNRRAFFLLTVEIDDTPSDEAYSPIGYHTVLEAIDYVIRRHEGGMLPQTELLLRQYSTMIRRRLMDDDPGLVKLARDIYRKHRRALDYVFEQIPDRQAELRDHLEKLIESASPALFKDHCIKGEIRFGVSAWDNLPGQLDGRGWQGTKRVLLFAFKNPPETQPRPHLRLILIIGPSESQQLRQRIFDLATARQLGFKPTQNVLPKKFSTIWEKVFLDENDFRKEELRELTEKIDKKWQAFLSDDLPKLQAAILKAGQPSTA